MANATSVDKIRGIAPNLVERLKEQKIVNADQLLKAGCSPEGRKTLAKLVGVEPNQLLEILNRADLDRIKGIGPAFANLLEEVGVDTVKELSKRVPANLQNKMVEVNTAKKITHHPPTLQQVEAWVEEAKRLPVLLEY